MSVARRRFFRSQNNTYTFVDSLRIGTDEPTWENSGCMIPKTALQRFDGTELVTSYDGQVI